ncbi:MAG: filamentous hemagglutinin N-terminal domain-containing protein [Cyanobacteriota bacterium]
MTKTAIMQRPSWRLQIALAFGIVGAIAYTGESSLAQITPDATLGAENSIVTPNANVGGFPADLIQGGATRGANLFHSFGQFNVDNGQRVYFANPTGIENILTRVTGNTLSNILGTLGVTGGADLFLLNPNGIIFGPNARLDVGGSFFATTANAVQFDNQGFFSATNPEAPGLLTVKPSAFFFNQLNAGTIVNQSVARNPIVPSFREGLRVPNGENLVLLGGNVNIDGGQLNAFGGRVEIGAVAGTGTVGLNVDGSLSFPTDLSRADVSVFNSVIGVAARDSGSVTINARNLDISGNSLIRAGILSGFGTVDSQAGDITLNATETLQIRGERSRIVNLVFEDAVGNSGDIRITAGSLFLTDGAQLDASTFGQGNGGNIIIEASDRVSLDNGAGIFNGVEDTGNGTGGNIRINTGLLSITNSAFITTSVYGQGNVGDILIDARDRVFLDRNVRILNGVQDKGIGDGGDIRITTGSLDATNGAFMAAFTFGQGNAGDVIIEASDRVSLDNRTDIWNLGERSNGGNIRISTGTLSIDNGARLDATTFGQGNAGNIIIEASGQVSLSKNASIANRVGDIAPDNGSERATGNGGDIQIQSGSLSVTNSLIVATTFEQGNAGNIFVDARDQVFLNNGAIANQVDEQATGNGGTIRISTGSLTATNLGRVQALTLGQGNAGNVIINARDRVLFEGGIVDGVRSGAGSAVGEGAIGNGGNIEITTGSLDMLNEAGISASTFGQGYAGNVMINARDNVSLNNSNIFSIVDKNAVGRGGNISITTGSLSLANTAQLDASTFGQGSSGNIIINARDRVSLDGTNPTRNRTTTIFTEVVKGAQGDGGNIEIFTGSLVVTNGAKLEASTRGTGNAGNIFINARDIVSFDGTNAIGASGAFSDVEEVDAIGRGGNIQIATGSLAVTNGAQVGANTEGQGDAGNVIITARDSVLFDNSAAFSNVDETAMGTGGNIEIATGSLLVTNGAQLQAQTSGQGNAGNVIINARNIVSIDGVRRISSDRGIQVFFSTIFSAVEETGKGNGGDIRITTGSLSVTNGAQLDTSTSGQGNAGNVFINARDAVLVDGLDSNGLPSAIFSDTGIEAEGQGGTVRIDTSSFRIANGALINARTANSDPGGDILINANTFEAVNGGQVSTTTLGAGQAGNITLNIRDTINLSGSDPTFDERSNRLFNRYVSEGNGESGLFASTRSNSTGEGGTITLHTDSLSLSDRAQIAANSQGIGDAGRVEITATEAITLTNSDITTSAPQASGGAIAITTESLSLNRGRITAATGTNGAQGAANITLQGLDLLFMGNESLIEANALNQANGGNVAIDSTFIVATPPTGPLGSDITANAFEGKGGRVSINTQGLFGIEFRPELTPDNDITVSSTLGLSGEYVLSSPGIDPSRGLAQLPTNLIDASQQIDRRCTPGGEARNSSFTITGRGGLPPSPNDVLQGETVVTSWVSLDAEVENNTPPVPTTPTSSAPRKLVEAQGWVINEKGEVVLTASAPTLTPTQSGFRGIECPASPPENASQL